MSFEVTRHNPGYATSPQINVADIAQIAAMGFKSVINNRPDGEGGDAQPLSKDIQAAAEQAGLRYVYQPVISGQLTAADAVRLGEILAELPQPVFAFCRTGARCTKLYGMAMQGESGFSQSMPVNPDLLGASACNWSADQHDIVIVGGGSAGIGLAASLLKRQNNLKITIIEPSDTHYYQPSWTLVGGGAFDIKDSCRPMASVIPAGVEWIKAGAAGFDPEAKLVMLDNGKSVSYQYLVVATGLKIRPDLIPGLAETIGKNGVTSNYSFKTAPYTWELVKSMKKGRAIFTQPALPLKCPGAPQKAMYLSCYEWQQQGVLKDIEVEFYNAGGVLFGVPDFVPPLMSYVKKYGAKLNFSANLVAVDGPARKAWFDVKDADGNVTRIERSFDMLHVSPPQGPQDCVKNSPLAGADGMVEIDQFTLQHVRYPNVFSLGDACSSPNSKTAAAARKQIVVVAENLMALRMGEPFKLRYDGYGSCPLTVERGKIVLAEFGFGGKLLPTFSWLINPVKASKLAWILKKDILPWLYWNAMLKGREWLARPFEN